MHDLCRYFVPFINGLHDDVITCRQPRTSCRVIPSVSRVGVYVRHAWVITCVRLSACCAPCLLTHTCTHTYVHAHGSRMQVKTQPHASKNAAARRRTCTRTAPAANTTTQRAAGKLNTAGFVVHVHVHVLKLTTFYPNIVSEFGRHRRQRALAVGPFHFVQVIAPRPQQLDACMNGTHP